MIFLLIASCATKKVYICGDHQCINKKEAKQYFEENMILEIQIIDKNKSIKSYDLVELNTKNSNNLEVKKVKERKKLRILNKKEIKEIENNLKKNETKKVNKKIAKLKVLKSNKNKNKSQLQLKRNEIKKTFEEINRIPKIDTSQTETIYKNEICLKIKNCDIESISKYLIKKGNQKDFPSLSKMK